MSRLLLVAAFAAALVVLGCGDDDDGPAANVEGTWLGQYVSEDGTMQGGICVTFEQDGRDISGVVVFEGEEPFDIGGRVANQRLSFVWSADAASTGDPTALPDGGLLSGDVAGEEISGTWRALSGSEGTWSAERREDAACS
jgi:hypothetical protein